MIVDKNQNEVKIGSKVKVLSIDPKYIATFSNEEQKIMKDMINNEFEVTDIEYGKPLVFQAFNKFTGIYLALDSHEVELVK
ncbi:hypothetical protein [Candidatus Electrothrix sp.]|uniref:hypothetical protein n=1 Tax=Candidatus Electrothrix sp. TaxID=2170559 RepID=UPI00405667D9